MPALLLALLLDCKPVELTPYTVKGTTKRNVTVVVTKDAATVKEGATVLFTEASAPFKVLLAADDGWVAMKGPYPIGSIRIAPVQKGAKLTTVDPLEHLTPEERQRVPETSCGTSWFRDWKGTPGELELEVAQGEAKPLVLRVKPDGSVSRK